MTAHELARILLDMPDDGVFIWVYIEGVAELMEIKSVHITEDAHSGKHIVLSTHTW